MTFTVKLNKKNTKKNNGYFSRADHRQPQAETSDPEMVSRGMMDMHKKQTQKKLILYFTLLYSLQSRAG